MIAVMKTLLSAAVALSAAMSFAQAPDFGGKTQAEKMKSLGFLTGHWEGEAWIYAQGRKIPVEGYEDVQVQAGGTCVMVNALWSIKAGERKIPVHEPCAMIYWNDEKKTYQMFAQLGNGLRNTFDITVREKGFTWYLKHESLGEVKYTMDITPEGLWHEVGERKNADGTYSPYIEMKLKKVK